MNEKSCTEDKERKIKTACSDYSTFVKHERTNFRNFIQIVSLSALRSFLNLTGIKIITYFNYERVHNLVVNRFKFFLSLNKGKIIYFCLVTVRFFSTDAESLKLCKKKRPNMETVKPLLGVQEINLSLLDPNLNRTSIVRCGFRSEKLNRQSTSWFSPKFPSR